MKLVPVVVCGLLQECNCLYSNTQVRNEILSISYDKISSRTFMFNDEEILQTGQDFNSNWNFWAKLLFLPSSVTHK